MSVFDVIPFKFILVAIVASLLLFYWIFNFIVLYHLDRFGVGTQPKKIAMVFLLGSVVLFSVCLVLLVGVDINSLLNLMSNK